MPIKIPDVSTPTKTQATSEAAEPLGLGGGGSGSDTYDIEAALGGSRGIEADAPRGPFVLVYNPEAWAMVGAELLPLLGEMPLIPGVNNVKGEHNKATGETRWNLDLLDVNLAKKGSRRIPTSACLPTDTPDGRAGYVRRRQMGHGWYYHTPWESIRQVGVRAVHGTDQAGYWAWVRKLIQRGVIPAPDASIIERMADRAQSIADAASARSDDASKRVRDQQTKAADTLRTLLAKGAGSEAPNAVA